MKKKEKYFFIILILILVGFLIIAPKLRPLNFASSEMTFPAINYLHEFEKSKSNGGNLDLYTDDGRPVLLGNDIPREEKLEITIKNKFINVFTNDLNLLIKNNTGLDVSIGESVLDGLEVYKNGIWLPLSTKQNASVETISHVISPNSSIVYKFALSKYSLKEGRYRAVIGYYNNNAYIVDSIEFTISGLF